MLIRTESMLIPGDVVTILINAITLITHCVLLGDHSARQALMYIGQHVTYSVRTFVGRTPLSEWFIKFISSVTSG